MIFKMIRKTTSRIFIHCAATKPGQDIGAHEIDRWHKARGWNGLGYHGVIRRNGVFEFGREFRARGAHVKGHNKDSIGICLVGGIDDAGRPDDNFTDAQYATLKDTLRFLRRVYPSAEIVGHNEFANKACPSFDVGNWLANEGFYRTVESF